MKKYYHYNMPCVIVSLSLKTMQTNNLKGFSEKEKRKYQMYYERHKQKTQDSNSSVKFERIYVY